MSVEEPESVHRLGHDARRQQLRHARREVTLCVLEGVAEPFHRYGLPAAMGRVLGSGREVGAYVRVVRRQLHCLIVAAGLGVGDHFDGNRRQLVGEVDVRPLLVLRWGWLRGR